MRLSALCSSWVCCQPATQPASLPACLPFLPITSISATALPDSVSPLPASLCALPYSSCTLLLAVAVGGRFVYLGTTLTIRRLNSTSAGVAVISVCRRGGLETATSCAAETDNDCNGLAGADDLACAAFL